jgi:membrane protein required for colicin V production
MDNLNWIDYIILIIFLFSVLAGFGRGLVKEIISLATLVAAFVVASIFSNALAIKITGSAAVQSAMTEASTAIGTSVAQPASYAALAISFGLLFAGTVIVGSIVSYFVNMAFQVGILGIGNRLLGAVFGAGRGFIINLVFIFIVQLTPMSNQAFWQQSQLVGSFQPAVVWLGNVVSPSLANLKEKFGKTVEEMGSSIQNISNTYQGFGH